MPVPTLDEEQGLADCVGAIYEAASGGGSWLEVGFRLRRLLDALHAILVLEQEGVGRSVLMVADALPGLLDPHIQAANPYRARARRDFAEARAAHLCSVKTGFELVPDSVLLRSAYYNDFARHHDMRYMIGGVVGVGEATPIALFRGLDADAFGPREVRLMRFVLPHLQRALELGARLAADRQSTRLTLAALDALPAGIAIVDAGLKILFVNDVARKYLAGAESALHAFHPGPRAASGIGLATMSAGTNRRMRQLVASVVTGGPGGSMWLRPPGRSAIAVLVTPLPPTLRDEVASRAHAVKSERHALVMLHPIGRAASLPTGTLCSLFGFTKAEEEVANALAGGATAQQVAGRRSVSLLTVRSQVRAILEKSESENLRDLERSMAALAALAPRAPDLLHQARA